MPEQAHTITVAFHVEDPSGRVLPTDDPALLHTRAQEIATQVRGLAGVDAVDARPSSTTRAIDPVTICAVLLSVKLVIDGSTSVVDALDKLLKSIRGLAHDAGLEPKVEVGRQTVAADLDAEQLSQLAARVTDTGPRPS